MTVMTQCAVMALLSRENCLDTHRRSCYIKMTFWLRATDRHCFQGGIVEREEELLNSKQVAVILDLSPDTVNEFARKNILPAFKKGKQWRFRKRDISIFNKKANIGIRDA